MISHRPLVLAALALATLAVALAALADCAPTDPDWGNACDARGPSSIKVGTGTAQYLPISDGGVIIETDPQGCKYIWLAVACTGLGPEVDLTYGITDLDAGVDLTGPIPEGVELNYDSITVTDQAWGLQANLFPDAGVGFDAGIPLPNPWCQISTAEQILYHSVLLHASGRDHPCDNTGDGGTVTEVVGYDDTTCTGCVYQACHAELAACGEECLATQACLDARCINLSADLSPDEETCQVYCQDLHPAGRDALIALAACVQASPCQPPCLSYSFDYRQCVDEQVPPLSCQATCLYCSFDYTDCCVTSLGIGQTLSPCAQDLCDCYQDNDCLTYRSCVSNCGSWDECQACVSAPGGAKGEAMLERYDLCLEASCIGEVWLPHQ
jgi:hypothetical protein